MKIKKLASPFLKFNFNFILILLLLFSAIGQISCNKSKPQTSPPLVNAKIIHSFFTDGNGKQLLYGPHRIGFTIELTNLSNKHVMVFEEGPQYLNLVNDKTLEIVDSLRLPPPPTILDPGEIDTIFISEGIGNANGKEKKYKNSILKYKRKQLNEPRSESLPDSIIILEELIIYQ